MTEKQGWFLTNEQYFELTNAHSQVEELEAKIDRLEQEAIGLKVSRDEWREFYMDEHEEVERLKVIIKNDEGIIRNLEEELGTHSFPGVTTPDKKPIRIPCPDNNPGCCVIHYADIDVCPRCKGRGVELTGAIGAPSCMACMGSGKMMEWK